MAKETFSLISDEQQVLDSLTYKLKNNLITKADYNAMTVIEREQVKSILFDIYSKNINPYPALSALEFGLFFLAKIFFKKDSGEELTMDEQAFYDHFKETVMNHEVTLSLNDWYSSYFDQLNQSVEANRTEYKVKKAEITGSF